MAKRGGIKGIKGNPTLEECRKIILKQHNDLRAKHGAAPLTLSSGLNKYAQEWADKLAKTENMVHRTEGKYGENLFFGMDTRGINIEDATQAWYDEIKMYDFKAAQFDCGTGHFTQVVWKGSRQLGVGVATSAAGNVYVVTNYDPPGNVISQFAANVAPDDAKERPSKAADSAKGKAKRIKESPTVENECRKAGDVFSSFLTDVADAADDANERPRSGTRSKPTANPRPARSSDSTTAKKGGIKGVKGSPTLEECHKIILKQHNDLRAKHGAAPLTLSSGLNKYAQEWADKLAKTENMVHRTEGKYGENLFFGMDTRGINIEDATQAWYDEIRMYDFKSGGFSSETGHFTQVVWKGSRQLGVGVATSAAGNVYVVANYDPPGNVITQFTANVAPDAKERPSSADAPSKPTASDSTAKRGGIKGIKGNPTLEECRKIILKQHNELRAKHGAAPLTISSALNKYAQEWADKLAKTENMVHRPVRKFGENLYYGMDTRGINIEDATQWWYDEIRFYNFKSGGFASETGHFTQVIWKDSRQLGVGVATSNKGYVYVVTNYDPPGNVTAEFDANVTPAKK